MQRRFSFLVPFFVTSNHSCPVMLNDAPSKGFTLHSFELAENYFSDIIGLTVAKLMSY